MVQRNLVDRTKAILPLEKRDQLQDELLAERLNAIIKEAMIKAELNCWIIVSREYNEDPITRTLTPSKHDETRRIGMIVFHLESEVLTRYWIGLPIPTIENYYSSIWDRKKETEWECLKNLIERLNPETIALNQSEHVPVADGLTSSLFWKLSDVLGEPYTSRFCSSEAAVVHWYLKRSEQEMKVYPYLTDLTQLITRQALSNEVIVPGVTTCEEVVKWMRQKVLDLGLETSFYPTIDVQRQGEKVDRLSGTTIQPGDIVHSDLGLTYLGLSTDMQQLGYVLRPDQSDAPEGLKALLLKGKKFADYVMEEIKPGRSGNDIFEKSIDRAKAENIQAMLYSHPIGVHCHESGPTIGMFDRQERIPHKGEFRVVNQSAYALEFNVKDYVPEWGQETYAFLEQPVAVYENEVVYLAPMQENFYLIR
ncbi:M24 family metallopeptidase [Halalkalibacillus halophilus]|uniref:M24 family metallopeptidase n=1 Tax=Halalkalibacillus halophilus TaxID=392827 RepID=UPI0003FEDF47|nr:M24 family metallopeptidase [Halalkalibacillus halophilus]